MTTEGFGVELPFASESLRARVAQADAAYERESQLEEHRRAQAADEARESAIQASIVQARARGEVFDLREAMVHGRGRTPAEAVEYMSAAADLDDARQAAAQRKAFAEFAGHEFYGDGINGLETEQAVARAAADARRRGDAHRKVEADRKEHRRISKIARAVSELYGPGNRYDRSQ